MKQSNKKHTAIKAFISYAGRFKWAFWGTALVFAVSDIVITLIPWIIGHLTTSLIGHSQVTLWTVLIIGASVGHDVLWRCGEVLFLRLLMQRGNRIDDEVFAAILRQPYGYFVDKFTGKVSSYANLLGREFRQMLDQFQYQYINLLVALPIIAITMFLVNIPTGAVFLTAITMMFLVGKRLARIAANAEAKEADERSTMDGYTVDAIANFSSVKAFGNEGREAKQLYHRREKLIKATHYSGVRDIWFWGAMSLFVRWIIWPSTFVLNIYLYLHGSISLAQVTTFLAVIVLFSNFIWEVVWNISQINIKVAAVEEAYGYLFGERNIFKDPLPEPARPLPEGALTQSLELRHVSFAYPDKPEVSVLNDINLTIPQGMKLGIVGPSGGGKSTLLKMLLGHYPLTQGELLVDGEPVANDRLGSLTAYVPQDTAVFHRPIRDNIAYGRPGATEAQIVAAAKHAQAHEFISQLDDGYDTLVGERGIKLSGGQRQRVAIARAILKDAPLLILDEATSALDSESERDIQAALWELMKDRTAIVVAHRLSTIQRMDHIVVLDHGNITESGTHAELLKHGGMYARLWKHQSGGFIQE